MIWLLPALAFAQDGFDGHGFTLAPSDQDLRDLLSTWRPENQVVGSLSANALFEYADSPVILVSELDGERTVDPVLDNLFGINLGLAAALHSRVGIGFAAPVWFTSAGINGAQGAALGDGKLYAPITVIRPSRDNVGGLGGTVIPFLDLPIGAEGKFLGDGGFGGGAIGSMGYSFERAEIVANLGIQANPAMAYENLTGGVRVMAALGGSYELLDWLAVRAEANLRPSLVANRVPLSNSPGEGLVSLRGRHESGLSWTAGGAFGITRGASAAAFRLFAGVGFTYGKSVLKDLDGDGIVDRDDACVDQPETLNRYIDDDGCPDELASVLFTIKDPTGALLPGATVVVNGQEIGRTNERGQLMIPDQVPGDALAPVIEVHPRTAMEGASIASFTLEPGLTERELQLQWLPGAVKVITRSDQGAISDAYVSFRGPVARDEAPIGEDGEEFFVLEPGQWTLLVEAPSFGIESRTLTIEPNQRSLVIIEVTLKPAIVQTTVEELVILEAVQFDFDKSTVKSESLPLLDQVAANLLKYDELQLIEVQGHTDHKGSDRYNRGLSQARVDTVLEHLVQRGVVRERLVARGYGEECPIASNATDEGRAENRRVQFMILDPAPEGGVPCHDGAPARRAQATTVVREQEQP